MDKIKNILTAMAAISYLVMGFVQLGAVYTFFSDHWGWWFIFAGPAALFIAGIPILGSVAGVIAAYNVWGWSLLGSILLFFWPLALYIPVLLLGGTAAVVDGINRRKAS